MNIKKLSLTTSAIIALSVFSIGSALAHGNGGGHSESNTNTHAAKKNTQDKTKNSVVLAWVTLINNVEIAENDIANNKLEPLHDVTEAMGGAVSLMQENLDSVVVSKQTRLKSALNQLSSLVGKLHVAADIGNAKESTSWLKKITGTLKLVKAQYPSDYLPSKPKEEDHGEDGHGEHSL